MGLFDLIMKRRSVRNFENRPVPEKILNEFIEAANNSPTAGNIQPLSVIVVRDPKAREDLAEMVGGQPWVRNAPLSMIFCLDFYRIKKWASAFDVEFRGPEALCHCLIAYADVMCAAQTVVLLAESHGLGSVYIGTIQDAISDARKYFEMPPYVLPMIVLTMGYPRSAPRNIPKLPAKTMAHMERYRTPGDDEIIESFEGKYGSVSEHLENYLERAYVEVLEADKQRQDSLVDSVRVEMKQLEIKSNAEFLFKLRYPSDIIVGMNDNLLASFKAAGFDFLGSCDAAGGASTERPGE